MKVIQWHRNSIQNMFLLIDLLPCIAYFHLLLLLFKFVGPLSPAACSVSWYRSCLVCSGLPYEIYRGGGPSTYVYCVVCYRVIVAPYIRSVGHVFAYLYILDDNSESPMDYETSLLSNVFPYVSSRGILSFKVVCFCVNHELGIV